MNTINTPFTYDVRVRDRLVKRGQLDPKDIEKHLASLPDVTDKCEPLDIPQPALGEPNEE